MTASKLSALKIYDFKRPSFTLPKCFSILCCITVLNLLSFLFPHKSWRTDHSYTLTNRTVMSSKLVLFPATASASCFEWFKWLSRTDLNRCGLLFLQFLRALTLPMRRTTLIIWLYPDKAIWSTTVSKYECSFCDVSLMSHKWYINVHI